MMHFAIASFRTDVTPPLGSPLCGGLVAPAEAIDDPLGAIGFVLLGGGDPIVQLALDWTALWNESHLQWTEALAKAARTTPDRVFVSCVHPHDAPMADAHAHQLMVRHRGKAMYDPAHHDRCVAETAAALRRALDQPLPVTHLAASAARVVDVASNRRVLGPDGRVLAMRFSTCTDADLRARPVGLIDPWLRTLTFYDGAEPVLALSSYACHPMSDYGRGRVSCDFFGLARQRRQDQTPGCTRVIVNGCLGDQSAGKYNDGRQREALTQRMCDALAQADAAAQPQPLRRVQVLSRELDLPQRPEPEFSPEALRRTLDDPQASDGVLVRAALALSRLNRIKHGPPLRLRALLLNDAIHLQLPGEPFVQFQLDAQRSRPDRFVMVSALSDDSPGYIPTEESFDQGGYEPTTAFAPRDAQQRLLAAMSELLGQAQDAQR